MNLIQAIVLGIIQGVTEFLPISSSGHLVLMQKIFGITEPTLVFDTSVHLGTLIAVFAVFKDDIISLLKKPFQKLTWLLLAGTIPTGIIGIVFKDTFEQMFHTGSTLGFEFIITGVIILWSSILKNGRKGVRETSYFDAVFIGIMQGLAIMPAISRSGLTISGALFRNLDRNFAARFSFLLSIPAILGAAVFQAKDIIEVGGGTGIGMGALIAGSLAAALAGYISIKFMLKILSEGKMKYFSYYVFALGGLVILDQYVTHIFF
ncbi:MAG: Bacitracin resistance protein BacA [Clostridia bacterium]|jgi:undecaprenyl-diphosphatase|nr:Bacitracin resistance protein BacA [Clostridia bacterium]